MMPIAIAVFVLLALLFSSVRVLAEWERGVLFRLGRFQVVKGAGLRIVIPGIDQLIKVSLREAPPAGESIPGAVDGIPLRVEVVGPVRAR